MLTSSFRDPLVVFAFIYSLIVSHWHTYALVKWVRIGSDNGLVPVLRLTIIWTNADLFSIRPFDLNLNPKIYIKENAFKSLLQMSTILSMW